jgi:hypothetical protein
VFIIAAKKYLQTLLDQPANHYAFFTSAVESLTSSAEQRRRRAEVNTFRTRRPILVNATQCAQTTSILTDSGHRKAYPGDWIIEGENHERYIVDNTFFQRTFAPILWEPANEGRSYGC